MDERNGDVNHPINVDIIYFLPKKYGVADNEKIYGSL